MGASLCKLTIICPREIEAVLADALDAMEPRLPGYTMIEAHGRGPKMQPASAAERVRGALRTAMFILILPRPRIEDVTGMIRTACPRPQISYWVEPVEDFGRLTDA
ncbi:DUF3240 family protein [Marinicaulis aureus]|uniref:DUF3240 family protein n=1 Tax=Hyphococcus aureus TaxID=2666033 RepID=A0ABW1KZ68_9PROT